MKELIEVVFENIPQKSSSDLIFELFDISKGINVIYCSTTLCEINKFEVENFLNIEESIMILMADEIEIEKTIIKNVQFRVTKFEEQIDVEFNFVSDEKPVERKQIIMKIFTFTAKLSEKFGVKNWYSGIEPASDKNTRYFTKSNWDMKI